MNAGEFAEVFGDLLGRCAEIVRAGGTGEGVVDIVSARYHEVDLTELFALVHEVELFVRALDVAQVDGVVVVCFTEAEGDHRQGDVLDRVKDVLVVAVVDDQSGGQMTEFVEALLDVVERLEVVEVVGVDVGDNGDVGVELEEGVDVLTRLTNDDVALTDIAVAA